MRVAAAGLAALVFVACASAGKQAKVAAQDDLSGLYTVPTQVRTNGSGPAVTGLAVSGTITNLERQTLHCNTISLLVVDRNGNGEAPISKYCDMQSFARGKSGYFSATFPAPDAGKLQLRLEHSDGTYETHPLLISAAR